MTLQSLINSISRKLAWHPQRCATFSSLVLRLIYQGSVQHQHLLSGIDHQSSYKAKLERIRRIFARKKIDAFQLCQTTLLHLYGRIPMMDIALDRTNWKFGKKDINFLMLSARLTKNIVFAYSDPNRSLIPIILHPFVKPLFLNHPIFFIIHKFFSISF